MKTLYQCNDHELEQLRDRLTSHNGLNGAGSDAIVAEAAEIIESERRSRPSRQDSGSGGGSLTTALRMVTDELAQRTDDRKLAAVLEQKVDAENRKPARQRAPIVNPRHVWTWLGDAKVWMEVGMGLDRDSRGRSSDIRDPSKSNVAHAATGFAFELAYKCLLVAEFEPFVQKHSCEFLHERLAPDTQARLEGIMVQDGWPSASACLKYLDEHMSNADRKYWMVNPDRTRRTGWARGTTFVVADSPMTIARLGAILFEMLRLAERELGRAVRGWDYLDRT